LTTNKENQWLGYAKRLQAIASTGRFFGESDFDKERYEEIARIANNMLGDLGNRPIDEIADLFPDFAKGYATPKVDVRAAVIRDKRILLVREKLDGLWTLPGGFADVGVSAAENVTREVMEESGLSVRAAQLFGVFHKAKHEYTQDARDFYKFYFLCEELKKQEPAPGVETSDAAFFLMKDLPPLSEGRSIKKHIALAFEYHSNDNLPTVFD
jgi:ADP-ribose pyrophosphatase YjhB (NUDIX family)